MITRHRAADRLARHRHAEAYVAVVLEGGYLEAGESGRVRASPGTVIAHEALSAHRDDFGTSGAVVLNLPAIAGVDGAGSIADADALVRAAERDPAEAALLLAAGFRPGAQSPDDWPDQLAAALNANPDLAIGSWADAAGLDATSVSRGFSRAYGVSPKRFRLEARARRAARALPFWQGNIAALAAETGFADQAHLARAIRDLTGRTPQALRAKYVQAETKRHH